MWEEREKRSKEWKTKLLRSSAEDIVKWRLAANILCYVIEKCWKYKRGGRLQFGKTYKHLNFLNMDNFVSSPKHSGSEGRHLIKKNKKTFSEAPFLGFLRLPSKYYWGCVFSPCTLQRLWHRNTMPHLSAGGLVHQENEKVGEFINKRKIGSEMNRKKVLIRWTKKIVWMLLADDLSEAAEKLHSQISVLRRNWKSARDPLHSLSWKHRVIKHSWAPTETFTENV